MEGIYEILNFLTGDNLFTHQLPRAMRECEPWLKTQFPYLMPEAPEMAELLKILLVMIESATAAQIEKACRDWVTLVRSKAKPATVLPEELPVYEMGTDMHTRIDPLEELEAMVGKDKIIVVE
jgi:hypothetical protein